MVPLLDSCGAGSKLRLFDHLVGEREQLVRNCQAERLGGFEVDDEHVLVRTLNCRSAGFVPLRMRST